MLSFNHIVFFEAARNLSFSKAAELLFISQPAISKHIKNLEQQYNVNLFERKGNSILLTPEGEILYEHISSAMNIQRRLEFDISVVKNKQQAKGSLVVGASTTVALYVMPGILSAFHKAYPHISLRLVNRNSENILKALMEQEIDLGIIEGENKITSASYKFFLKDEVVPVCSAKSHLVKKRKINVQELKTMDVALRERGSGTLAAVTEGLLKHHIKISDLETRIILGGTEALKNFLLDDTCIGFLPLRSVARQLQSKELVRLNIPGLQISREFYFVQRQGNGNDKMNSLFIKMAIAHYNQLL